MRLLRSGSSQSSGTDKMIGYCVSKKWKIVSLGGGNDVQELGGYKPVLVVSKMTPAAITLFRAFLVKHKVGVLNVAGHRSWAESPSWQSSIEGFLLNALDAKSIALSSFSEQ
jgi:hypothetical protein